MQGADIKIATTRSYASVPSASLAAKAVPMRNHDEAVSVGVVAARVASAARRVIEGQRPADSDLAVIRKLREGIARETEAIKFTETGGASGSPPVATTASMGLALDAFMGLEERPEDVSAFLVELADLLKRMDESDDKEAAERVEARFRRVIHWVKNQVGSSGDIVVGVE